jgi:hypothetical protein
LALIFAFQVYASANKQEKKTHDHEEAAHYSAQYWKVPVLSLVGYIETQEEQGSSDGVQPESLRERMIDALIASWPLVFIGILGVFAALLTLWTIKRQTDLQEVAMRQWVDTANWSTNYRVDPASSYHELEINFDIVNPTGWPLTLLLTKFRTRKEREKHEIHRILLAPRAPYAVRFCTISLDKQQQGRYAKEGITLLAFGCIVYRDCFEKIREQIFSGSLRCVAGGVTFTLEWIPDNPYAQGQQKWRWAKAFRRWKLFGRLSGAGQQNDRQSHQSAT